MEMHYSHQTAAMSTCSRMQLSQRLYSFVSVRCNKLSTRVKTIWERVHTQLATHSQVLLVGIRVTGKQSVLQAAARVVRIMSLFCVPVLMFVLVLLSRRAAPSLVKRLAGSAEMIFLFVVMLQL